MTGAALAADGLTHCDREPIHLSGAVQPHGALLAFDPADGRISHWSQNLSEILSLPGDPAGRLVDEVIGTGTLERIDAIRLAEPQADEAPLSVALPWGASIDAAVHPSDGLVVVEFESPTRGVEDGGDALLHDLRLAVWRLESAVDVRSVCAVAVDELRRLTGYDRVMVYQFHADEHGEVIAEARVPKLAPYLGLHYPATDIPHPARRLLRLSSTRLIADVDASPVPLVASDGRAARMLDLSRSSLRAVSPIHLQYLRNMGVAASLTISLCDGPLLWGLLACHHTTPYRPSAELRAAAEVLARTAWLRIEALEELERHAREHQLQAVGVRLLAGLSGALAIPEALVQDGSTLLELAGADGARVRIDGISASLGATPPRIATETLLARLRQVSPARSYVSDAVGALVPELRNEAAVAAGVLAVPVSDDWSEHIIWFRGERERTTTWAGDPAKGVQVGSGDGVDPVALGPRSSFEAWSETVRGHSHAWSGPEVSAAGDLATALPAVRAALTRDALARRALRDSLTGLPNRALLLDRLEMALRDVRRAPATLSVLFLDLDGFKAVNDTFGHESGDRLLVEVARRLARTARAFDTVARLGGDEFVLLCPADPDAPPGNAPIEQLAARLLRALAEPIEIGGRTYSVTTSIGIASVGDDATPAQALAAADAAMYRAKREGPNRMSR